MTTAPADAVDLPSLSTGHAQFDSDQALLERLDRFNKAHGVDARLAEERLFRQAKAAPSEDDQRGSPVGSPDRSTPPAVT